MISRVPGILLLVAFGVMASCAGAPVPQTRLAQETVSKSRVCALFTP